MKGIFFLFSLCCFLSLAAFAESPPGFTELPTTEKTTIQAHALQIEAPTVDAFEVEGIQFSDSRLSDVVASAKVFAIVAPLQRPTFGHGNTLRSCGQTESINYQFGNKASTYNQPDGLNTSQSDGKAWNLHNTKH